jgi:hypothetical protein
MSISLLTVHDSQSSLCLFDAITASFPPRAPHGQVMGLTLNNGEIEPHHHHHPWQQPVNSHTALLSFIGTTTTAVHPANKPWRTSRSIVVKE